MGVVAARLPAHYLDLITDALLKVGQRVANVTTAPCSIVRDRSAGHAFEVSGVTFKWEQSLIPYRYRAGCDMTSAY